MIDLNHIERLARAATPGPWEECGHDRGGCTCGFIYSETMEAPVATATIGLWGDSWPALKPFTAEVEPEAFMERSYYGEVSDAHGKANARFIAALSPDVVLALVEMARRGRGGVNGGSTFDQSWRIAEEILTYFDSYRIGSVAPIAALIEKALNDAYRTSPAAEIAERVSIEGIK